MQPIQGNSKETRLVVGRAASAGGGFTVGRAASAGGGFTVGRGFASNSSNSESGEQGSVFNTGNSSGGRLGGEGRRLLSDSLNSESGVPGSVFNTGKSAGLLAGNVMAHSNSNGQGISLGREKKGEDDCENMVMRHMQNVGVQIERRVPIDVIRKPLVKECRDNSISYLAFILKAQSMMKLKSYNCPDGLEEYVNTELAYVQAQKCHQQQRQGVSQEVAEEIKGKLERANVDVNSTTWGSAVREVVDVLKRAIGPVRELSFLECVFEQLDPTTITREQWQDVTEIYQRSGESGAHLKGGASLLRNNKGKNVVRRGKVAVHQQGRDPVDVFIEEALNEGVGLRGGNIDHNFDTKIITVDELRDRLVGIPGYREQPDVYVDPNSKWKQYKGPEMIGRAHPDPGCVTIHPPHGNGAHGKTRHIHVTTPGGAGHTFCPH
jgi:hypothetical protein